MNRRIIPLIALLVAAAGALGTAAVITQRQMQLRGAVDGLPPITLAHRVPILGVNAPLHTYDQAALDENLDPIAQTGFVWVRQVFDWALIEPQPGSYDWSVYDRIVAEAAVHDLRVVAVLTGSPGWAANIPGAPPEDTTYFAEFARAAAARYGNTIQVYQIWDEPNISSGWGEQPADPVEYAVLLEAAYNAIHAVDPTATVLTAGLAPTTETAGANIADVAFLRALYENGAAPFFDGVAGKPYGFDTGPDDRRISPDVLNASRMVLLREEMVRQGDGDKPVWASHFGWNSLPGDWEGHPSIWGQTDPNQQAAQTLGYYERALLEWPWAGALILDNWQPDAPPDDPRWGFALRRQDGELTPLAQALQAESDRFSGALWPGIYPADTPLADYEGDWEFSDLGADFSEFGESLVTVPFAGDSLGIIARRDNYRAYLYVSVDGEPARGLPQEYDDTDDVGRNGAYLVLTSPDYQPRVEAVPIAQGYTQGEIHMAHLAAERGWDQWALAGFAVGANVPTLGYDLAIGALLILTGAALLVGVRYLGELNWIGDVWRFALNQVNAGAQMALTAATAIAVWIGIALTLGGYVPAVIRDSGSIGSLIFTALTAGVFYFSPTLIATLIALLFLFVLLYSKPVYGPMLMVLFAPFYLLPRPLFDRAFSMVEVVALLTLAVWVLRTLAAWGDDDIPVDPPTPRQLWFESTPLDKAVVLFTGVAVVSLVWSDLVGVAVTELRMMVLEPAVLYLFLRTVPMEDGDRWRIVDALVIAGVVVAFAGFVQFGQDVLSTQGFVCLRSVTGTCNNAALFLGRIIPITAAVLLFNVERSERRWLYAAAGMIMLAAMALTTSRGGLLLGLPAGLGLVLIVWGGRRAAIAVGAGVALMFVSLIPLGRLVPRFNLLSQSNLFRIQLWQSTLRMLRDHPITGLGLDQFLYAYRGGYILPAAWQQPDLSQPHNVLLNYWVRLGIVGLVAGIWMQIAFWRMAIATQRRFKWFAPLSKRAMTVGLMGSMAAFLAHGMVDATHFVIDLSYVFFMTLGLMHQLHEESVPVGGQQPADL